LVIVLYRGAPDLEFSNPAGTGFTGFGQKFRPDLPDKPVMGRIGDKLR
jgi:hypothetical protein